ncbi:MAG: nicotinate phosphoribosyltransferase [Patescibacteria group bacterium]
MFEPIIRTLMDIDFYKFTMGHLIFLIPSYRRLRVKFAFRNRTPGVALADIMSEEALRWQLDQAMTLRFNNSDLHYLRGTNEYGRRMFDEQYLEFLRGYSLPSYHLERSGDTYVLEFEGPWAEVTYWETIALAIINELYTQAMISGFSSFDQDVVMAEGRMRLADKISRLRAAPFDLTLSDFGTRRRWSRFWQEYVVRTLAEELPRHLLGTSNTWLAMKLGLLPMGTSAHELPMAVSGLFHDSDEGILHSQMQVLDDWWELYGEGLSIALPDTYGTESFFRAMGEKRARDWKGTRQDSGDPFEIGEMTIAFYEGLGIDPKDKLLVFSDGLDVDTILALFERFQGRIRPTFGWGTNLTNDLGIKPLSLVIKVVESNGHGTVKLSDNLAKAIGTSDDVERFKHIFGYTKNTYTPVTY